MVENTEIKWRSVVCEECFSVDTCETKVEQWYLGGDKWEPYLVWKCTTCKHRHQLECKGDPDVAVRDYNRHMLIIQQALKRAAKARSKKPDKDEIAFQKRLRNAERRDKKEGGNKYVQRVRFGWWLRRARRMFEDTGPGGKFSQAAAARKAGISREQWNRLEMGRTGYTEETVLLVSGAVGATVQKAFEVAGFKLPPRLVNKSPADMMRSAVERSTAALDIEDDTQWLTEALMARRTYRLAKTGDDTNRIIDVPVRAHAVAQGGRALEAIARIEKQADRIGVFRAVASAYLSPEQRLRWCLEIVANVLSEGQRQSLVEMFRLQW